LNREAGHRQHGEAAVLDLGLQIRKGRSRGEKGVRKPLLEQRGGGGCHCQHSQAAVLDLGLQVEIV
jgi:hypothetical protein